MLSRVKKILEQKRRKNYSKPDKRDMSDINANERLNSPSPSAIEMDSTEESSISDLNHYWYINERTSLSGIIPNFNNRRCSEDGSTSVEETLNILEPFQYISMNRVRHHYVNM